MNDNRRRIPLFWKIVIGVVIVLLAIRIALPYVVLHFANKNLQNLDGYSGRIDDVDLALIKGEYLVKSFYVDKVDSVSKEHVPFVGIKKVGFSIDWDALFHGKIKGDIYVEDPMVRFTKDKAEPKDIQKDTTSFRQVLDNFMPLQINRVEIRNGIVHYRDPTAEPMVDLHLTELDVTMENLSNVQDTAVLPSTVRATANIYGGAFYLDIKLDLLKEHPTFDMTAELKQTDLTQFNPYFEAYANFDVEDGSFAMFSEIAGKDGRYTGYVKPVIHHLDVVGKDENTAGLIRKLWEATIGAVGGILSNPKEDQIATKVPLEGEFDKTTVSTWYAIALLLRNAFIQALLPAVDHEINLASVEDVNSSTEDVGFFKRAFGGGTKDNRDKQKSDDKK